MTKKEAVQLLGLEKKGSVDYALPQPWADDFKVVTLVYPVSYFVWFYPERGEGAIFGYPYPLTVEAKELLAMYNTRRGTNYPIPEYPKPYNLEIKVSIYPG
jgi:hypothetical protein